MEVARPTVEATEDHIMEDTRPTVATGATVEDMDMARDLLMLSPDMATLVMAILATGVMEDTEVMEVMEPLTDLMEVVDITIKRALHSKSSYCNTTLHGLLFTLEAF